MRLYAAIWMGLFDLLHALTLDKELIQDNFKEHTRSFDYRISKLPTKRHIDLFPNELTFDDKKLINITQRNLRKPSFGLIGKGLSVNKRKKWNRFSLNVFSRKYEVNDMHRRKRSIEAENKRQKNTEKEKKRRNNRRSKIVSKANDFNKADFSLRNGREKETYQRSSSETDLEKLTNDLNSADFIDKNLLGAFLDDGYTVRIYNTITYDVIFRKNLEQLLKQLRDDKSLQSRKMNRNRDTRQHRNRNLSGFLERHRRHLAKPSKKVARKKKVAHKHKPPAAWRKEKTQTCLSNECRNGGSCLFDRELDTDICLCADGFYGFLCETSEARCANLPCLNGGTCVSHGVGFQCSCRQGFVGRRCQTDVDDCASAPCQNGGKCHDLVDSYRCLCDKKYEGENCQNLRESNWLQMCKSNPCLNGGVCLTVGEEHRCVCARSYTGFRCEVPVAEAASDTCASIPCANGGICQVLDGENFNCMCPALFSGKTCEARSAPCKTSPCSDNETCSEDLRSFDSSFTCAAGIIAIEDISIEMTKDGGYGRSFGPARVAGIMILLLIMFIALCCVVCSFQEDEPSLQERKQLVSYSIQTNSPP